MLAKSQPTPKDAPAVSVTIASPSLVTNTMIEMMKQFSKMNDSELDDSSCDCTDQFLKAESRSSWLDAPP